MAFFFDICKERQAVDKEVNDQAIAKAREDSIKAQTAVDEIVKRQPDATKWSTADLKTILTSLKRKIDGAIPSLKKDRYNAYLRWKDRVEPSLESEGAAVEFGGDGEDGEEGDNVVAVSNEDEVVDALLALCHTEEV